ncbi:MAG: pantoate--beta-alanine ligase [Actinobacteria bacterium]|nr:pantoate--beta-alanine ligase [Actinomycetota bacterium]
MTLLIKSTDDLARQKFDAFVPTMGALHAGHQSLIKLAKEKSGSVLVSIFVNPLQFENPDDLAKYPKSFDADLKLAEAAGATAVFAPSYEEVYPGEISKIEAGAIGDLYEGASRAGHFSGMLTVVKRLFDLVKPKIAIFGEKDFQQLFLIKQMVKELKLPIKIISAPIIRESDGLAMSSRNVRLDDAGRKSALIISKSLNENSIGQMQKVLATEPGFELDYLEIIDEETFLPATPNSKNKRAIIAGWVNGVRLLDNKRMGSSL